MSAQERRLSPRERQVMASRRRGLTIKEIAQQHELSPNTVKCYVARVFQKLGARSSLEAVHRLAA